MKSFQQILDGIFFITDELGSVLDCIDGLRANPKGDLSRFAVAKKLSDKLLQLFVRIAQFGGWLLHQFISRIQVSSMMADTARSDKSRPVFLEGAATEELNNRPPDIGYIKYAVSILFNTP